MSWQAEFFADKQEDHPWYGPCDANGADGGCSECANVRFSSAYAAGKRHWWHQMQVMAEIDAARRARRKERRKAKKENQQ